MLLGNTCAYQGRQGTEVGFLNAMFKNVFSCVSSLWARGESKEITSMGMTGCEMFVDFLVVRRKLSCEKGVWPKTSVVLHGLQIPTRRTMEPHVSSVVFRARPNSAHAYESRCN